MRYVCPVRLEADPTGCATTGYAGALPILSLWTKLGMPAAVDESVHICGPQGWMDRQIVESVVLLNALGGDCIADIDKLEDDAGLCEMVRGFEYCGLTSRERKAAAARFHKKRTRALPAPTQISAFLEACHDEDRMKARVPGKAFIPQPSEGLQQIINLNRAVIARIQELSPQRVATLDGDATLVPTDKLSALFAYKGGRAYQPYNVFWAEHNAVLFSEFRDGNVPAAFGIKEVFARALEHLPAGVEKVYTRQDTAAYNAGFLAWCERAREHPAVGRIEFSVSVDITTEFKAAAAKERSWQPEWRTNSKGERVRTGREFAEVVFVPASHAALSDIREPFVYIAIRERMGDQLHLLDAGGDAPFPTVVMDNVAYKLHGIVTNRRAGITAEELIRWHFERCGKSEEAHSIMKSDLAGGQMPSAKFGANAAWWALMILSFNFLSVLRRHAMGPLWMKKRMKAVRFGLINTAGRLVTHSRRLYLRVAEAQRVWIETLLGAIGSLSPQPG